MICFRYGRRNWFKHYEGDQGGQGGKAQGHRDEFHPSSGSKKTSKNRY